MMHQHWRSCRKARLVLLLPRFVRAFYSRPKPNILISGCILSDNQSVSLLLSAQASAITAVIMSYGTAREHLHRAVVVLRA
jgi:hypothetical protein